MPSARSRVVLVASGGPGDTGAPVPTLLLQGLLDDGWEAHLLNEGGDANRIPGLDSLPDEVLRAHVHPPPARLRGGPRPELRRRLARAVARSPIGVARQLGPGIPSRLRYLRAILLALDPDVVHLLAAASAQRWADTAALSGARLVISLRGEELALGADDPESWNRLWKRTDGIVVESAALGELARRLGAPGHAVAVVPPPVERVLPERTGLPELRNRRLRLVSLGPLSWTQGLEHGLRAARLLADEGVDCEYRIVGDGEFVDALGFARHQLGLDGAVEILEPPPDGPDEHLRWADALVVPAVVPAPPETTWRALALGVPVVTTDPPPGAEDAVLAVPRRDPEALAAQLALLARDREVRRRLATAGRARVAARGGASAQLEPLLGLYRALV